MLKLNRGDQAKQCFMEALALDVKCFEAFDQLVSGEMMTADEGMSANQRSRSNLRTYDQSGNSYKASLFLSRLQKMPNLCSLSIRVAYGSISIMLNML